MGRENGFARPLVLGRDGGSYRECWVYPNLGSLGRKKSLLAKSAAALRGHGGLEGDLDRHSLRGGFATAAARAGRTQARDTRHGRWKRSAAATSARAPAWTIIPRC
jgi:hypothetical protein